MTECVKYLYEKLGYTACSSCRFVNKGSKMCGKCSALIKWGISEQHATELVNEILEINNKEGK